MKQAMIFAAGLGTRLKPLTDTLPKALVPIHQVPMLEYVILKLKVAGFNRIVVNVHHFADLIVDFLARKQNFGLEIYISDERDALLETGGGIKKAIPFFNPDLPVLIHNVDIISNIDLNLLYNSFDPRVSDALLAVSHRDTFRYFLFDNEMLLKGWTNLKTAETKPDQQMEISNYTKLAFSGIQLIAPQLLKKMGDYPDRFPITDFYLNECKNVHIKGFIPKDLKLLDVGKIEVISEAENFLKTL